MVTDVFWGLCLFFIGIPLALYLIAVVMAGIAAFLEGLTWWSFLLGAGAVAFVYWWVGYAA